MLGTLPALLADMQQLQAPGILGMVLIAMLAQACALDANEPGSKLSEPDNGDTNVAKSVIAPRCERLDDLGVAASGSLLSASSGEVLDAPCTDLAGGRIETFAGRVCWLVAPTGFSLNGCFDSYDCSGCPVELRSNDDLGFVLSGTSPDPACADIFGKYALISAPACGSQPDHL